MGIRINFFGGPCVGKSTLAAQLFAYLKAANFDVEQVQEFVKTWAYQGRKMRSFDYVYTFANQLHAEDIFFQAGVNMIVTDSPLLLQVMYGRCEARPAMSELQHIAEEFERAHESINFLVRRSLEYKPKGRYQSDKEAAQMHEYIVKCLDQWRIPYVTVEPGDLEAVVSALDEAFGIKMNKLTTADEKIVLKAVYDLHCDHGFTVYFDAHRVWLQAADLSGATVSKTLFALADRGRLVKGEMTSKGTYFAMDSEEQQRWRD